MNKAFSKNFLVLLHLCILFIVPKEAFATPPSCSGIFYSQPVTEIQQEFSEDVIFAFKNFSYQIKLFSNSSKQSLYEQIQADPIDSQEKIKILRELGFDFNEFHVNSVPDWYQFSVNYRNAMKKRGKKIEEVLVPALVFTKNKEIALVDPLTEKIPRWQDGWEIAYPNKEIPFNIPMKTMIIAMKQGKYPLFMADHDVFHFVAFLKSPDLSASFFKHIKKIDPDHIKKGFGRRLFWLLEFMSYPDPSKKTVIQEFLANQRQIKDNSNLASLRRSLDQMPDQQLLDYTLKLSEVFPSVLMDISGAASRTAEKRKFLQEFFYIDRMEPDSIEIQAAHARRAHMMFFERGPLARQMNGEVGDSIMNLNPLIAIFSMKALCLSAQKNSESRNNDITLMKDFIIFSEYMMLKSTTDMDIQNFVKYMLEPSMDLNSPGRQYFLDLYPGFALSNSFVPEN